MSTDFIGFSFDGIHSSYLGLKRVSDGQFYNEQLQSNFENKLKTITGMDGQLYFGANYSEKEFKIKVAFDSITEKQFRQITALFSTKKICNLIFDERPYKMYKVRLTAPIELSYICFDEPRKTVGESRDGIRIIKREEVPVEEGSEETVTEITRETVYPYIYEYDEENKIITERIYKGEGEISLSCFSPMAQAPFKTLDDYMKPRLSYDILTEAVDSNFVTAYDNVDEWKEASGILSEEMYLNNNIDRPVSPPVGPEHTNYNIWINVFNPGDIDSPFMLYLPYYRNGVEQFGTFGPDHGTAVHLYVNTFDTMEIAPFTASASLAEETGVLINSKNHLIEGVRYNIDTDTWATTGNLYNNYIIAGDFSTIIKQDILQLVENEMELGKQTVSINYNASPEDVWIKYDYLYY